MNVTQASLKESFDSDLVGKLAKPQQLALQLASRYLEKMMLSEATIPFFEFQTYKEHF